MHVLLRGALALTSVLALRCEEPACKPGAPCYSDGGVVSAASNLLGPLAPYTWTAIRGTNLSTVTLARGALDARASLGGVRVTANSADALVTFVSPDTVIALLPPADAMGGPKVTLRLTRNGAAGPAVTLDLNDCAPALFQLDPATVVAAHSDGSVVSAASPARAGERVVLYATGLGPYLSSTPFLEVPDRPNPILRRAELAVFLDGVRLDDTLVHYAGAAVGVLGVYQIDLELPRDAGTDPEIRIQLGSQASPTGVHLPVK
jgi:uncharacterized protein (TIGR03437 family)